MDDKVKCSICENDISLENVVVRHGQIFCVDCAKDIVMPIKRDTPKVGRNDICLCGSGKKYKSCCLRSISQ